jgi:hypothetical protein
VRLRLRKDLCFGNGSVSISLIRGDTYFMHLFSTDTVKILKNVYYFQDLA